MTIRFRRWKPRCASRTGCWRPAATCRPRVCSTPTRAASSRGSAKTIRCCGGARIRAWCSALDELHVSRSLRRTIRSGRFDVTLDTAFDAVMRGCAEPRGGQDGTWITRGDARRLRRAGRAAATRIRWRRGRTARSSAGSTAWPSAGCSSASRCSAARTDASKVALACLVRQLDRWEFELIDCQMSTTHLASLGAREIPRAEFVRHVARLTAPPGRRLALAAGAGCGWKACE